MGFASPRHRQKPGPRRRRFDPSPLAKSAPPRNLCRRVLRALYADVQFHVRQFLPGRSTLLLEHRSVGNDQRNKIQQRKHDRAADR